MTDDEVGTVTFHLTEPDPNFLYELAQPVAFPVPDGTSDENVGDTPIPGTGPYEITEYVAGESMTLERRRDFEPWTQHRPGGYVDEIVVRIGVPPEELADEVLEGRADYVLNPPLIPPEELDQVMTERTELTHTFSRMGTFSFFLNTSLPPFDDVRVRRALNFAVDREAMLDSFPFPSSKLTCQILPPAYPGYQPYCPFTIQPDPAGTWTAPDLDRAEDLIERSGTTGMRIDVWEFPAFFAVGEEFVALLEDLDYLPRLHVIEDPERFFDYVLDSRNEVQTAGLTWLFEARPSPIEFFRLVRCGEFVPEDPSMNLNPSQFCDHRIDAAIDRAQELHVTDPAAAAPLWAKIDRAVTDAAPWVSLVNPGWIDIVSDRVGNYQSHPVWGILLDQVWVR